MAIKILTKNSHSGNGKKNIFNMPMIPQVVKIIPKWLKEQEASSDAPKVTEQCRVWIPSLPSLVFTVQG